MWTSRSLFGIHVGENVLSITFSVNLLGTFLRGDDLTDVLQTKIILLRPCVPCFCKSLGNKLIWCHLWQMMIKGHGLSACQHPWVSQRRWHVWASRWRTPSTFAHVQKLNQTGWHRKQRSCFSEQQPSNKKRWQRCRYAPSPQFWPVVFVHQCWHRRWELKAWEEAYVFIAVYTVSR